MSSLSSSPSLDICSIDVLKLYLKDDTQEPAGYVLCEKMATTCKRNGCSCRRISSKTRNGVTKYFGICVLLPNGDKCLSHTETYIACAQTLDLSAAATDERAQKKGNSTTNEVSSRPTIGNDNDSLLSSTNINTTSDNNRLSSGVRASNTAMPSSSMNSTIIIAIIAVIVVFVAVSSWIIRSYCIHRSKIKKKMIARRNRSIRATNTSPTNLTGRSSPTPSFPPFDRRVQAMHSPVTGDRRRGNQGAQRGRNASFAREPNSGRGREPRSGRGRNNSGTVFTGRSPYEKVAQFAQLAAFEAPAPVVKHQRPIKPVPVAVPKHTRSSPVGYYIDETPIPTDYDILSPKTARSLVPSITSSATTVVVPGRNRPTSLQSGRRPQNMTAVASYYQSGYPNDKTDKYKGDSRYDDSRYDDSKYDDSRYNDSKYDESRYDGNRYDESEYDESKYDESKYDGSKYDESKYDGSKYDESKYDGSKYDESGHGNKQKSSGNYYDSFMSEDSSMAWSRVSSLSDGSYYLAPPTNRARIPVIEAPRDDDDALSEDAYSDWGRSTRQTPDDLQSTVASFSAKDASFFSVQSDFTDSGSEFKEREF